MSGNPTKISAVYGYSLMRPTALHIQMDEPKLTIGEKASIVGWRFAKGAIVGLLLAASVVAAATNPEAFTRGLLIGVLTSRAVHVAR